MTNEEEYEQYIMLHRDFSKTYSQVYKHVMDFYPEPQKFVQETVPEIDTYVKGIAGSAHHPESQGSFQALTYFARNVKELAANANEVFEEYKALHNESGHYIKDIFRLKEKVPDIETNPNEFTKLIPVLKKLISGFKRIERRTDETAKTLQQLQRDWKKLKTNISDEEKGTAWPL